MNENWESLKLVPYNDEVLKNRLPDMELSSYDLKEMETNLITLSKKWHGAGLSANQVGLPLRYFVITIKDWNRAYFNPEIDFFSKDTSLVEEGCLSRPGLWLKLSRPIVIRIRYTNSDGQSEYNECAGLLSRIIQHEYDHMNGSDFTELAGYAKLQMALKKQKTLKTKLIRNLARQGKMIIPNPKGRFKQLEAASNDIAQESKPVND